MLSATPSPCPKTAMRHRRRPDRRPGRPRRSGAPAPRTGGPSPARCGLTEITEDPLIERLVEAVPGVVRSRRATRTPGFHSPVFRRRVSGGRSHRETGAFVGVPGSAAGSADRPVAAPAVSIRSTALSMERTVPVSESPAMIAQNPTAMAASSAFVVLSVTRSPPAWAGSGTRAASGSRSTPTIANAPGGSTKMCSAGRSSRGGRRTPGASTRAREGSTARCRAPRTRDGDRGHGFRVHDRGGRRGGNRRGHRSPRRPARHAAVRDRARGDSRDDGMDLAKERLQQPREVIPSTSSSSTVFTRGPHGRMADGEGAQGRRWGARLREPAREAVRYDCQPYCQPFRVLPALF